MKGIWISAIVVAFVAGTILTGAAVYATDLQFPITKIKTATGTAFGSLNTGVNADVTLECDQGDLFLSGSAHGVPLQGATPLVILINKPQVNLGGSIEWHATARNPDLSIDQVLEVNIICLHLGADGVNGDETDTDESETSESETDESETNDD